MPFVIDASIAGAWLLRDEATNATEDLLNHLETEPAVAADLLRHEVRSLVLTAVRRGRLVEDELPVIFRRFEALPLRIDGPGETALVTTLAGRHRLSAYDAAHLALALSERRPLATLDQKLRAAAVAEGVTVLPEDPAS